MSIRLNTTSNTAFFITYFVFSSILTPYQSHRLSRLHSEGHVPKNLHAAHKHTQAHKT